MAIATLMGVRDVTLDELKEIPCPAAEGRWRPVPHHEVVQNVTTALVAADYQIDKLQLGLARADARLFGTAILSSALVHGVSLAVGFRSSLDKSISLQWCCGSKVTVCGNMAFSSEKVVARKHSTNGAIRFVEAISRAVAELAQFRAVEAARIRQLAEWEINDTTAESLLLRCYEAKLLSPRTLPVAIEQWRRPAYEDFEPRTGWSIYNAATYALNDRVKTNPQAHAHATIRLGSIIAPPRTETPAAVAA